MFSLSVIFLQLESTFYSNRHASIIAAYRMRLNTEITWVYQIQYIELVNIIGGLCAG